MSEGPLPKTWQEALPYIAWGAIVVACFLVFIERLVAASYGEALAALIIGIATTAVALHSKDWLARTNPNWMYAAALLFVATLILWPNLEEKRWPFSAWFPLAPTAEEIATAIALKIPQSSISIPTADQIAEAVVHKLPLPILATKNTSALAPQGAPVVYVNPLHDARAKWGLASWLASTHTNCSVTIVRLQEAYSEDFAADLKPILDTIGWEYQEQFANKTIPK